MRGAITMPDAIERGREIKRRRLRLDIPSLNKFEERSRIPRKTLGNAEEGTASPQKMDQIEAWLDRVEEEDGIDTTLGGGAVKVSMRDVFGVGELDLIFEQGGDPQEVARYVGQLLEELKRQGRDL